MYKVHVSSEPLTDEERYLFQPYIDVWGLDRSIWDVYSCFLNTSSAYSIPRIVRIKEGNTLLAACYMMNCKDYGSTLTSKSWLQQSIRNIGIPVYIWMKSGIAAENFANPGFIRKNQSHFDTSTLIKVLKRKFLTLFIHDLTSHAEIYPGSSKLRYPDDGIIKINALESIGDYLRIHKNLKKKLRHFRKHGGSVEIKKGQLDTTLQEHVKKSVLSTSRHSLFRLPYQEHYAEMCRRSTSIPNDRIVHFICKNDQYFLGYHTFIQFEKQLRCMHGAFNRDIATTHHAYENMIYRTVEYGIEQQLDTVYYGPVLNETKRRMMDTFVPTQLYLYSSIPGMQKMLYPFLKSSRLQQERLLEFSSSA